ncbi:RNA polymerase sigma factor [Actinoplanes sp. NBRC 14428]|nr:RNA polymerase sigma factor [Actinoplanes sp. NBRC 14428]
MPDQEAAFRAFFEKHHAELARLAYLLTGEASVADDLAADALVEVWRHWTRVEAADDPAAYARGIVANLTRKWIRGRVRDRHGLLGLRLLSGTREGGDPDLPAVLDVRSALRQLPHRRRACVVLRYAFDLSEREVAQALGISVGAVKSQTSRGARQLAELLGGPHGATHIDGWEAAR